MSKKSPKLGDWIIHKEPSFDREHEGKVVQLLSMQFVYETESGDKRFCMFRENWTYKNA
jgi:hypothetical protein